MFICLGYFPVSSFSLTLCVSTYALGKKNVHLTQSSWTKVTEMPLTHQPCHRFWGPLHNFAIVQIAIFFLAAARHLEYSRLFQHSEISKTKTSLPGSPWKSWNMECVEKLGSGDFSPTHSVQIGSKGYGNISHANLNCRLCSH